MVLMILNLVFQKFLIQFTCQVLSEVDKNKLKYNEVHNGEKNESLQFKR